MNPGVEQVRGEDLCKPQGVSFFQWGAMHRKSLNVKQLLNLENYTNGCYCQCNASFSERKKWKRRKKHCWLPFKRLAKDQAVSYTYIYIHFSRIHHKSKSILWQANPFLYHRIWEIKRHNLVIQFRHNSSEKKSAGSFWGRFFFLTAGGTRWDSVDVADWTEMT